MVAVTFSNNLVTKFGTTQTTQKAISQLTYLQSMLLIIPYHWSKTLFHKKVFNYYFFSRNYSSYFVILNLKLNNVFFMLWNEFPSINIQRCTQADWLFSCGLKPYHLHKRGLHFWAFCNNQTSKMCCVLRGTPHSYITILTSGSMKAFFKGSEITLALLDSHLHLCPCVLKVTWEYGTWVPKYFLSL